MRILWVTDLFPHAGRPHHGAWLLDLARAMARRAEVVVLSPRYRFLWVPQGSFLAWYRGQPPRADYDGVRALYPASPALPAGFYMALQSLSMAWSLLAAARREHRKRPFDLVHGQPIIPGGAAAAWISRRLSLPLIVTGQGADVNEFSAIPHLKPLFRSACRRATRLTAVSRDLACRLEAAGFPGARWIPNGCRIPGPGARPRRAGRVLFVGHLYERKAPEVLIEAFRLARAEIPHATLDLVGDGPDAPNLRAQVRRAGLLDEVRFFGPRPHGEVRALMEEADVFCLPSRREGWPLAVVEALAAGLPVVGTGIRGIREILHRPELGLLVPPGDPTALAGALGSALRREWDRELLRAEARRYDWERIAEDYLEAYREAIASRRTRSSSSATFPAE